MPPPTNPHTDARPAAERRRADRRRPGGSLPPGQPERRRGDRRAHHRTGSPAMAARQRRYQAAYCLHGTAERGALAWEDLVHWPDWGTLPSDALDRLAWAAGAWAHAHELRRCIDGRLLTLLRHQLGSAGFAALLEAGDPPEPLRRALVPQDEALAQRLAASDPQPWDQRLHEVGRECLLATIGSAPLRHCLRLRHWPDAPDAALVLPGDEAAAIVRLAWARTGARSDA